MDAGLWINTAWLKKLGLEMPKTTEEFYKALVAFRDGDPNGNGIKDEIPLGAMQSQAHCSLDPLFGAFGTMDYLEYVYQNNEGKVVFGGTEDSYRNAIDWLHTLYSEGLIDPECFTMTDAQFSAKAQGKDMVYGALMFWMPDSMDSRYYDDYEAVMPLKSTEDVSPLWPTAKMPNGTITGFTITTACKNPAALVRYYDNNIANLENVMAWYNGEEGKGIWKRVDGTKWAETAEYMPEGVNMSEFERTVAVGPLSPAYMWSKYNSLRVQEERMIKKINANNGYLALAATRMINGLWVPEDLSERELLYTDIDNYMKKFKANAIVNGIDDAAWAEHLATLESLKVNEYVGLWQKFCDK